MIYLVAVKPHNNVHSNDIFVSAESIGQATAIVDSALYRDKNRPFCGDYSITGVKFMTDDDIIKELRKTYF